MKPIGFIANEMLSKKEAQELLNEYKKEGCRFVYVEAPSSKDDGLLHYIEVYGETPSAFSGCEDSESIIGHDELKADFEEKYGCVS